MAQAIALRYLFHSRQKINSAVQPAISCELQSFFVLTSLGAALVRPIGTGLLKAQRFDLLDRSWSHAANLCC